MELVALLFIGFVLRGTWEHLKKDYRTSSDQRVKEVAKSYPKGALPKSRRRAATRQHAFGWWTREAGHGFPVTRTGWHAAWLAHKAEAHAHATRREEAAADATEAEVARNLGISGARQRRAAAQAELDKIEAELADQRAKGSPATGKEAVQSAADEVARKRAEKQWQQQGVPPLPADTVAREVPKGDLADHLKAPMPDPRLSESQRQRDLNGQRNVCAACGHPGTQADDLVIRDGHRIHQSHTHDPDSGYYEDPAPARRDDLPGGPMHERNPDGTRPGAPSPITEGAPVTADTNYTTVLTNAKLAAEQAEQDAVAASQRRQVAQNHAEEMQAAEVDGATLSSQMELVERLQAAEQAAKETGEHAQAVFNGLQQRHGGLKAAHDDAPVRAATREFYEE